MGVVTFCFILIVLIFNLSCCIGERERQQVRVIVINLMLRLDFSIRPFVYFSSLFYSPSFSLSKDERQSFSYSTNRVSLSVCLCVYVYGVAE